jgi:hypothetical protein
MNTPHTPGPWTADPICRESDIEPRHLQVKAAHAGESIPIKKVATVYYGVTDDERIANARLIAAAPALLAAVAAVAAAGLGEVSSELRATCRAAIALATRK